MLRLASYASSSICHSVPKHFLAFSRSRYGPASRAYVHTTIETTKQAASVTTTSPRKVIFKDSFRVGDKTIGMNLEETKTGVYLKLVESVEKRAKRSVYIPIFCVVPFSSAVMEFSAISGSMNQDAVLDSKVGSFVPKRFPLRMEGQYLLIDMRKSKQGFYLNIETGQDSHSVVIPAEGIADFQSAMQSVLAVSNALSSCGSMPYELCAVFVSGLAPTTSSETLSAHVTAFGQVERAVVLHRNSSHSATASLCCGVVQFSSSDEAAQAASSLTSSTLEGSVLQYHIVGSVADPDKLAINEPLSGLARVLHPKKVFVGGLPKEITTEEVTSLFSEAGTVVSAEVLADKKGRVLGFAEVEFSDPGSAQAAIAKLNGREMEGRWIYVRELFVEKEEMVSA